MKFILYICVNEYQNSKKMPKGLARNKVDLSPNKAWIVEQLTLGNSYGQISEALAKKGESISRSALHSYHLHHLGGAVAAPLEPPPEIEKTPILVDETQDFNDALKEAFRLQTLVLNAKLKEHIQGGKFPEKELRAIKELAGVLKIIGDSPYSFSNTGGKPLEGQTIGEMLESYLPALKNDFSALGTKDKAWLFAQLSGIIAPKLKTIEYKEISENFNYESLSSDEIETLERLINKCQK